MTEYDYSPDAIERHLAKQAAIANWVDRTKEHEPANPFVILPDERARLYPQQQQRPQVHPQPAVYTAPRGLVSPTYSSAHASTSSTKKNKSSSHGTSSHHPSSSRGTPAATLPNSSSHTGLYFASPPTSPNGISYLMPQVVQPPTLMQSTSVMRQVYPLPTGSAATPVYSVPQVAVAPSYALQPTPNQPVVVPINGGVGGYVVVPAGQGVTILSQPSQYPNPQHQSHSDSGSERGAGGSFFGSLKPTSPSHKPKARKNKKLKKQTRTD